MAVAKASYLRFPKAISYVIITRCSKAHLLPRCLAAALHCLPPRWRLVLRGGGLGCCCCECSQRGYPDCMVQPLLSLPQSVQQSMQAHGELHWPSSMLSSQPFMLLRTPLPSGTARHARFPHSAPYRSSKLTGNRLRDSALCALAHLCVQGTCMRSHGRPQQQDCA